MDNETTLVLNYKAAIADWLLDIGDSCFQRGNFEKAALSNLFAATILTEQSRNLSSPRIESNLQLFAKITPQRCRSKITESPERNQKEVWLHVMTEALPYGGHTNMAIRWIKNDQSNRTHSVALISQNSPIPDRLLKTIHKSGGEIYTANLRESILRKADWLRKISYNLANYVVLHIRNEDIIPGIAFGVDGGPPILLVNHSAHKFWIGSSIADLVINCRGSELEEYWTRIHRGIPRCTTIPIPLLDSEDSFLEKNSDINKKNEYKKNIGIPENSIVILTVGENNKYIPMGSLNFFEASEVILKEIPDAFIIAVGPEENNYWKMASEKCGLRLKAIGRRFDVEKFHRAADIYIEGFPFGSTTALLEAGICGIPVVLAPAQCPPPFGSDGLSLDEVLTRPNSVEEYINTVIYLCKNPKERDRMGKSIRYAIKNYHTGYNWRQYLESAIAKLPNEHCVYSPLIGVPTPQNLYEHWYYFVNSLEGKKSLVDMIDDILMKAYKIGLQPNISKSILQLYKVAISSSTPNLKLWIKYLLLYLGPIGLLIRAGIAGFQNIMRRLKTD